MVQAVQFAGVSQLTADLATFADDLIPAISVRALNKGINKCKSFSVKTTATAKKLTQKQIRSKWSIRGAKRNPPKLSADLLFTSRPVPWIKINSFNGGLVRGGVSAGATRREPRGFVATMPSGYTSSWVRREVGKPRGTSNPYKGLRSGLLKKRLQIDEITQTLEPEGQSSTEASIPFGLFEYEKEALRLMDVRLAKLNQ